MNKKCSHSFSPSSPLYLLPFMSSQFPSECLSTCPSSIVSVVSFSVWRRHQRTTQLSSMRKVLKVSTNVCAHIFHCCRKTGVCPPTFWSYLHKCTLNDDTVPSTHYELTFKMKCLMARIQKNEFSLIKNFCTAKTDERHILMNVNQMINKSCCQLHVRKIKGELHVLCTSRSLHRA